MESSLTNSLNTNERLFIHHYQVETLLQNIPQLIYMKNLEGNFVLGTKVAEKFTSCGEDVLENIVLDISEIRELGFMEDKYVIENDTVLSKETELFDKNGIPHYYSVYKAPIKNFNNEIFGVIVILKNIDTEKMLEAQKETFVASLGHDLKNPTLAQIRALELLLKGSFGEMVNEQKEVTEMVLDSCRYMNGMLASLLATYRNERGVIKLHNDKFSLSELVRECISEMIYVAKDKNVEIVIEDITKLAEVQADKVQIKRVVMNLLSNGIKYAEKNSELLIRVFNKHKDICFQFENKSPYMSPEKRKAIFAQYVSFAEAHKELGIGLGLYTSQKIIEAHDGELYVESFTDNRNIFGFRIPNELKETSEPRTVAL